MNLVGIIHIPKRTSPACAAMSALDGKAAFVERLRQLGVEDELKQELKAKGFET